MLLNYIASSCEVPTHVIVGNCVQASAQSAEQHQQDENRPDNRIRLLRGKSHKKTSSHEG